MSVCVCVCLCARACVRVSVCMLCAADKTQGEEPACRHILATAVIARRSCAWALRHLLPHRKPMLQLTTPHTHIHSCTRTNTHITTASPYSVNITLDYMNPHHHHHHHISLQETQTHTFTLGKLLETKSCVYSSHWHLISSVYVFVCVCVSVCE